jgi:hypothetical protein
MDTVDLSHSAALFQRLNQIRNHLLDAVAYHLKQLRLQCFPPDSVMNNNSVQTKDKLFSPDAKTLSLDYKLARFFDRELTDSQRRVFRELDSWKIGGPFRYNLFPLFSSTVHLEESPQPQPLEMLTKNNILCFEELLIAFAGCIWEIKPLFEPNSSIFSVIRYAYIIWMGIKLLQRLAALKNNGTIAGFKIFLAGIELVISLAKGIRET